LGANADADAIRAYAKERVAASKYPREVFLVEELPEGPTGKSLEREIGLPR
jgi:long-chain acyl-CoA synthetase